jgi:hypothetical protein
MNRELLEKPFDPAQIKQREGSFGNTLDYVEAHAVIQRLNDAFEGNWSFEIVKHEIVENEVVVLGRLAAEGLAKMQFGNARITKDEGEGTVISMGDDFKAAATDSMKKCATLLGVGLHLYGENGKTGISPKNGPVSKEKTSGQAAKVSQGGNPNQEKSSRLTNKQLTTIFSIGKGKGLSNKDIKAKAIEVFNKQPEFLTKGEASTLIKELFGLSVVEGRDE